jgi:altronate hydrolase
MDVNCGTVIDGEETVEQVGKRVFELVLKTASGSSSKSELNGYGDEEFNPWQVGVVM